MSIFTTLNPFRLMGTANPSFEGAGRGRRLRNFFAPRVHINKAIERAGPTLIARARWLYENDGYCGNAVEQWASDAVGDGIKPRPKIKDKKLKAALVDLFWRWTEEADADGMTDYYGLQAKAAREAYLAGECFFRIRARRPGDMHTVPFQLQFHDAEMLDHSYSERLSNGNFVRAGIEFDAIGRRVAYHFWRWHPNDDVPMGATNGRERVRVPAEEVIHVIESRQGSQVRGVPRVARVLVKIFGLEMYDDAELERKKTAALFTAFLIGRGENPITDDEDEDEDGNIVAGMEPGATIDLGDDKDIKFAQPADVGGSYEPFQYRNLLKISAGLGIPYAYLTGDVTKGNFSNVRTDIIRYRRRVSQWQNHVLIFQLCRAVWVQFVERAYMAGLIDLPGYDKDPTPYWAAEHLPPRQEWIDPAKDVKAEKEAMDAGLKSRTQAVAERGYDREALDDEIEEERKEEKRRGLNFRQAAAPAASPAPGEESDKDHENEEKTEQEAETNA
ncbi:phage portal protein [Sinorhizobium meliloti]|uniref:phage portal protein n=1 Tax=Rhizobium meliloti TaxID=382 RepID=UPI000FDC7C9D|nr:phage portal protein [Sinorhizobium meliloti]RVH56272.1 phage portal protein [Sinorhizobium meliloti]